jgi:hypothetical protein
VGRFVGEDMGKALILSAVACTILAISLHARAKQTTATDDGYQTATVVSVTKHASASNYVGNNPSDAPLQALDYSYDIGIRLNCNIYVGRYESAIKYLPSVLAPNHEVDVRLHKHVMYVSLSFSDEEVMMGIVSHRRAKDEVCAGTGRAAFRQALLRPLSNQSLTLSKFKGGLV